MTIRLNEDVINTLRDELESDLPTLVASINAANLDPLYPLPVPYQVLDYIPPVAELTGFPTIGISDGDITFEDDTGWGATGLFDLTIVCFLQSPNHRELVWWLRRYGQAIVRSALEGRRLGAEGWGVTLKSVRPGPTLGRDENPRQWLSTTAVTITVKTEQDS